MRGRIAWLVQNALSARDAGRFGVEFFAAQGFAVTVIDVADLINPLIRHDRSGYGALGSITVDVASRRSDLARLLPVLRQADLIISTADGGHVTPYNLPVLRLLGRCGRPWLSIASNAYPGWSRYKHEAPSPLRRVLDIVARLGEIRPLFSLVARLPQSWLGVAKAAAVVEGGARGFQSTLVGPQTRHIHAHAMDYDLFLAEQAKGRPQENIAVFVDEGGPLHPDFAATAGSVPLTADDYFPAMVRLFDRIERDLGLEVVIAACPRIDYAAHLGLWGRRRVEVYKTSELIARSRLVIGHRSTALGMAVMFGRPILQVSPRRWYQHLSQRPYFDGYAAALGRALQFCDDPAEVDLSQAMTVDAGAYARYMSDYVKQPDSPPLPYWQIVQDDLQRCGILSCASSS